jgi:thiosulfate/3-mercaptopyruvate sulfurtransferase
MESAIADPTWVENHLEEFEADDSDLRLVEVEMDPDVYEEGHVPGAAHIDWEVDLAGHLVTARRSRG